MHNLACSHEDLLHGILKVLLLEETYHSDDMIGVILVVSRVEGDNLIISPFRELCLDLGLFLFLVRIHRGHVRDWRPSGNGSPLAFRVLEPFCWSFCVPTHDRNEKRSRLQKKLLERTLGRQSLDPFKRVTRYLCRERNLESRNT
jgi:hypothetical protein